MIVFCWIVAVGLGWFGWIGARADPRHPLAQLFCIGSFTAAAGYVGLNLAELTEIIHHPPAQAGDVPRVFLAGLPIPVALAAVARLGLNLLGASSEGPDPED